MALPGGRGAGADSVSSVNPEKNAGASFLGTSVMESKIIWRIGIFYFFLLWLQGTLLFSHLYITLEFRFAFAFTFSCSAHGQYFLSYFTNETFNNLHRMTHPAGL